MAHEQGIMRTLLIVTDTERARPRRSVTGSVARFDRFLLFSASPECKRKVILGNSRKLRKSIKGRQAKGCVEVGVLRFDMPTESDGVVQNEKRARRCCKSRSQPPSTLPAPGEAALCCPKHGVFSTYRKIMAATFTKPASLLDEIAI